MVEHGVGVLMIQKLEIRGLKCPKTDLAGREKFCWKVDRYTGDSCDDTGGQEPFLRKIYEYWKDQ